MHASKGKLLNPIKKVFPEKGNIEVRERLQNIEEHCEKSSKFSVPPFRFRKTIPKDEIIYNREITMDLIC